MIVIIDGVNYSPTPKRENDISLGDALNVRIDTDAGNNITIKEYFHILFKTLWIEAEGFNGKRPFGNSDWQWKVYTGLIKEKFIEGSLDEDGCIDKIDTKKADEYIIKLINKVFFG